MSVGFLRAFRSDFRREQAGAELCQDQLKLEVIVGVGVEFEV